jgi:hypothetical protein
MRKRCFVSSLDRAWIVLAEFQAQPCEPEHPPHERKGGALRHSLRYYRRKAFYSGRLQYRAVRSLFLLAAMAGSALLMMRILLGV